MVYLIVNNDFHIDNLLNHMDSLQEYDICVIRIPYNLTNECMTLSENVITIDSPYKNLKKFINPFNIMKTKRKVRNIKFSNEDTVIFLTEYDPINQYVVFVAKKNGAKTILLEEGVSTYYNNISFLKESVTLKSVIKSTYLKYILGFKFVDVYKNGSFLFLKMKDIYIDEIVLYHAIELDRKINTNVINSSCVRYDNLNKRKCLFLNQPIYQSYLTSCEYLEEVNQIITALSGDFEIVYFKFHPRDSEDIKKSLKEIISNFTNVSIVSEKYSLADTVDMYKPYFAISFFSDALFKLSLSGLSMVFLYPLIPKLKEHSVLKRLSKVLEFMEYNHIKSIDEINLIDKIAINKNKLIKQNLKYVLNK